MTRLTADQGPQARYTAFLKALRGHVDVVVGTRAAAFAPVHDLGLVAWWDDGDDLLDEPRAPYPHVREVLLARAEAEGAAVLAAGHTRSVAVAELVESGVLAPVEASRAVVRAAVPSVRVAGEGHDADRDPAVAAAHLPSVAWRTAKEALLAGSGARPGAPARLPPVAVLPDLPAAGALPGLLRSAGAHRSAGPTGVPLVRTGRDHLPVPVVRGDPAALVGRRCPAHRRGAGPGVPRRPGRALGGGRRPRDRCRRPAARGVHTRRRAGRCRGLRRGAAARRVGAARAAEPGRGGGDPAALDHRGGARAPGVGGRAGRPGRGAHRRLRPRGRGARPLGSRVVRGAGAGRAA